jgi:hypothetical protein
MTLIGTVSKREQPQGHVSVERRWTASGVEDSVRVTPLRFFDHQPSDRSLYEGYQVLDTEINF